MSVETLRELLIQELQDIYHAETQAIRIYPKIAKKANAESLTQHVQQELDQTRGHVEKLDRVFEALDARSKGKPCEAMKGLIEEVQETLDDDMPDEILDAALLAHLQKMKHYEIAGYGTLRAFAQALGVEEAADLLQEILDEEKFADQELTRLAVEEVNLAAAALDDGNGDDEDDDEEDDDEDEDGDDEDEIADGDAPAPRRVLSPGGTTARRSPKAARG